MSVKKSVALIVCLMAISGAAIAAPKKSDADAWAQEFKQLKWKATDALTLRDAVGAPRGAMRAKLTQLEDRARRVFGADGQFSACITSAERLTTLFDSTFSARSGDYVSISAVARGGVDVGQWWGDCSNAIDALK